MWEESTAYRTKNGADSEMETKQNTTREWKTHKLWKELCDVERRDVYIILVLMLSFIARRYSVCII